MTLGNILLVGLAILSTAATAAIVVTGMRRGRPWKHVPLLGVVSLMLIGLSWGLMRTNRESLRTAELGRLTVLSNVASAVVKYELNEHHGSSVQLQRVTTLLSTLKEGMDSLQGITLAKRTPDGNMVVFATTDTSGSIKVGGVLQESAKDFAQAWEGKPYGVWVPGTEWDAITASPVDSDKNPSILMFAKYDSSRSASLLASSDGSLFFPTLLLVIVCLGGGSLAGEFLHSMAAARVARATLESQSAQIALQLGTIAETNQTMAESRDKLSKAYAQLHHLASVDGLTGVMNHRTLMDFLGSCMQQNSTIGAPCSVILLDVDNFKLLNDEFGHIAGDEALRVISSVLKQSCPQTAGVGRYGGEEFMMVLPAASESAALAVAEELRRRVQMAAVPSRPCTVSVGVSTVYSMNKSAQTLIDEADRALYQSKAEGKNRVTHFGHGAFSQAS